MNRPVQANRNGHRWIIAAALALALVAFIALLSTAQVASSGAGRRVIARTVAAMTEIDDAMPDIQASLQDAADQSEVDPIPVPDFPIPVEVPRDIVIAGDRQRIRDEILSQSAERMYDDGVSVWDDTDPDASQDIARNSTAGGLRAALSLVGSTPRTIFIALAAIAGLGAAVLAFALTFPMSPLRRLTALGAVLVTAGIPAALVVLLIRLITSAAGDDSFGNALADIAVDADGVGLRNYVITSLLGIALLALGTGGTLLERRENGPNGLSFGTDE